MNVLFSYEDGKVPYVCGGGLPGCYEFLQLHFHWGITADVGSEHTINGQQ